MAILGDNYPSYKVLFVLALAMTATLPMTPLVIAATALLAVAIVFPTQHWRTIRLTDLALGAAAMGVLIANYVQTPGTTELWAMVTSIVAFLSALGHRLPLNLLGAATQTVDDTAAAVADAVLAPAPDAASDGAALLGPAGMPARPLAPFASSQRPGIVPALYGSNT